MGVWQASDTVVFDGLNSSSWRDLDLSAIVGTNVAFCLFAATSKAGNGWKTAFRPKGSTLDLLHIDSSTHGMSYSVLEQWASKYTLLGCLTNSAGIVEHQESGTGADFAVTLLGYNVLSHPGPVLTDADLTLAAAGTFTNKDISAHIGTEKSFSIFGNYYVSTANATVAVKTPGDARTSEYTGNANPGGGNRGLNRASGKNGLLLAAITDSNGTYDIAGYTGGVDAHVGITWEGSEVDNYVDVNQVIDDFSYVSATWQDLDLSAHVGSRSLCVLLVEHGATGTASPYFYVKRKGDLLDYSTSAGMGLHRHICTFASGHAGQMIVECDDDGKVEVLASSGGGTDTIKVTLLGYIPGNSPPVVTAVAPVDSTVVGVGSAIQWTTTDNTSVDPASINLEVSSSVGTRDVVINGVSIDGWTYVAFANAGNGYDCTATPDDGMERGNWAASVEASDGLGATTITQWVWTVALVPALEGTFPTDFTSELDKIRFRIADDPGFEIYMPLLIIRAVPSVGAPIVIYTGQAFQTDWDGIVSVVGSNVEVVIDTFPTLQSPMRWTIEVEMASTSGV